MAPVTEHTEPLGEQPAFWRSAPGGDPPVLYLHGVPNTGGLWTRLLERTGGVAPDLAGFGRSGKRGDGDFTMTGLARWLDGFLDLAGLDRVRLVVHDWGARRAAVGHAQPRAGRAPGDRQRRAVPARLPLARLRPRVAHAAARARSPWA